MLQIKNISKQYKTGNLVQKALDDVSLNLRDNEFVAILGPSGSGKTTLLNIIGGLDRYDSGDLIINEVSTKEYKDRDWDSYRNHTIGFVFQSYNLIPHQTILSNVELALTISGIDKSERRERAIKALEQVGLKEQMHKKPNQLSGGQMQRVAIARALVNNPDIVLADEPTGALDSETSIQVMDLLKEVAKDRLVVMVTHNPELAERYATRIVNLRDGKIRSDSDPFEINEENQVESVYKKFGKTAMSFLTSLSLSFNNLKTKKGRTILTSFAGSIGIIGIALILSLSNGVNSYIKSIEEDTLSEYPLQIQSSGFDLTSMINIQNTNNEQKDSEIKINKQLTNMFSTIGSNDLKSLKTYLESDECPIDNYAKNIEYKYDVSPRIYLQKDDEIRQVNPDITFTSLGIGSGTSNNSFMSSMMSTNVFFQMPSDENLYINQYDVKAGKWPENYNECVLVLSSNGGMSDFLLYTLGLRDYDELDEWVKDFSNDKNVTVPENLGEYSYDDIIGKTFKLVDNSDCYEYDSNYNLWRDKTDNTEYMKKVVKNGEDLKIVGVVQPKEDASSMMLSMGICYPQSLTTHVMDNAKNSEIVKQQLKNPDINVFTGKSFDDEGNDNAFDMNSLMQVDTNALQSAFKFDQSKIKVDFGDLSGLIDENSLPELDLNDILNEIDFTITDKDTQKIIKELLEGYEEYVKNNPDSDVNKVSKGLSEYLSSSEANDIINKRLNETIENGGSISNEEMQNIFSEVLDGYSEYAKDNDLSTSDDLVQSINDYLKTEEARQIIIKNLSEIIKSQNVEEQVNDIMDKYMSEVTGQISYSIQAQMQKSMQSLSESISNAISIDPSTFAGAFKMNMSEEELSELFTSLLSKESVTYENNLKKLNYANPNEPSGIDIYPKDFEGNKSITNLLNEYNERMEKEGNEDKVISFTDMVGTLMSSVTNIVDTVSYVLIAFVSISLVVSSIMIGVITYISVLERKKEIGILRAMGASKRNISQVFNAETIIIGALAGVLGVGISLLALIPINKLIYILSDGANVKASLPISAAIILIILSIVLTLIGGIIPSKKAAKEDPVLALRSE